MCSSSAQTKVLIVGLDGASPKIINQLAEQGDLPYLRALFSRAPLQPLESVPPYATPAAWSTIYTGLPPASHGILDFVDWSNSSMPLADSASLRAKPIWQRLSEQGKRVAMIAFPLTYPPPVVNGVMVSGLPAPHRSVTWTHPAEFDAEIKAIRDFTPDPEMTSPTVNPEESITRLERHLQTVTQASLTAHQRYGGQGIWDLFGAQFQALDAFQHMFWAWIDPDDRRHTAIPLRQRQRARAFFHVLDECIQRLVEALAPEHIVLLSDHGFGPAYEAVCLNHILLANGLLKLAVHPLRLRAALWAQRAIKRIDIFRLRARLRFSARRSGAMREISRWMGDDLIDHSNTPAVNLSGGYCGLIKVRPGFESLVEQALLQARHPAHRTPLIESVQFVADLWKGPQADKWRQIAIAQPKDGYLIDSHLRPYGVVAPISAGLTGTHRPTGMLWTTLPDLQQATSLFEIAPAVLNTLGSGIDSENVQRSERSSKNYSAEDQRAIEERLRQLGYL